MDTLDLIVLRALDTMGPQHAYSLATRLEQVADDPLVLNQGTLYVALVRLEQRGWIKGTWGRTDNNREAKFYLAALLAAGPDPATRDPVRSMTLLKQVMHDVDVDPTAFEIRAAANAIAGDFKAAQADQRKALRMAQRTASPSEEISGSAFGCLTSTATGAGAAPRGGGVSLFIRRSRTKPRRINPTARMVTAQ